MPRCFLEAKQPFSTPQYMFRKSITLIRGFPGDSDSKESPCNSGNPSLIPGSGRPLQKGMASHSSILAWRIPWQATVHGVTKGWTRLSDKHFHFNYTLEESWVGSIMIERHENLLGHLSSSSVGCSFSGLGGPLILCTNAQNFPVQEVSSSSTSSSSRGTPEQATERGTTSNSTQSHQITERT